MKRNDLEFQKFTKNINGDIGIKISISSGDPNTTIPADMSIEDLEEQKFESDGSIRLVITNE